VLTKMLVADYDSGSDMEPDRTWLAKQT